MSGQPIDFTARQSSAAQFNRMLSTKDTATLKEAVTLLRADLSRHKRGIGRVREDRFLHCWMALELLNDAGNLIAAEIERRETEGAS